MSGMLHCLGTSSAAKLTVHCSILPQSAEHQKALLMTVFAGSVVTILLNRRHVYRPCNS